MIWSEDSVSMLLSPSLGTLSGSQLLHYLHGDQGGWPVDTRHCDQTPV